MSDFLKKFGERVKEQFLTHISAEVKERFENPAQISIEEYASMRLNSWEAIFLIEKLSDECFLAMVQRFYLQSGYREASKYPAIPEVTYDEALIQRLLPELMRRFQKQLSKV